jgi:hypothetical protein
VTIKRLAALIGCVLIGFGIVFFFVSRSAVPAVSGAFQTANNRPSDDSGKTAGQIGTVALAAYGFLVTLIGVALGSAYRRLMQLRREGTQRIAFLTLLGHVASSVDFQIGLVGSPLVFGLLWQSIGDISVAGLTVIALQNGFASHAILDQIIPGKRSDPQDASQSPEQSRRRSRRDVAP